MKEAEAVIDELLDWQAKAERPNFDKIEAQVLKLREELSRKMVSVTLSGEEETRPIAEVICPKCGGQMHYKGMKKNRVNSGAVNSYAEAALVLQRIGHQFMSASSIWRRVEKWGTQFKEREQVRQVTDMALPHRSHPVF